MPLRLICVGNIGQSFSKAFGCGSKDDGGLHNAKYQMSVSDADTIFMFWRTVPRQGEMTGVITMLAKHATSSLENRVLNSKRMNSRIRIEITANTSPRAPAMMSIPLWSVSVMTTWGGACLLPLVD